MPRSRGRPREFDQEKVLDLALDIFWRQGYEGTSIADLVAATGITAPSLYAAFGSKEQLYRRVLDRYLNGLGRSLRDALQAEPTAYGVVKRFLYASARLFADGKNPPGCLISCGVLACAPENKNVAAAVAADRAASVSALRKRFQAATKSGELRPDTDSTQLARFYGAILQGMSVQAMDGANVAALRSIVEVALRAWPGTRPEGEKPALRKH